MIRNKRDGHPERRVLTEVLLPPLSWLRSLRTSGNIERMLNVKAMKECIRAESYCNHLLLL